MKNLPDYAELHAISNFTFLRGASHPEELVRQAHALGYRALAVTDECSLAGIVRAHVEARELDFNLICGSEFTLDDNTRLVLLAPDRWAYGELSALITHARRAAEKGEYHATRDDVDTYIKSCLALWLPANKPNVEEAKWMVELFGERAWIAASRSFNGRDRKYLAQLADIGARLNVPLVATGNVYFHARERRPLQDVITAIRLRKPVDQLKGELQANAEH